MIGASLDLAVYGKVAIKTQELRCTNFTVELCWNLVAMGLMSCCFYLGVTFMLVPLMSSLVSALEVN